MTAPSQCGNCDADLPPDAPAGLCPACLLRIAVESGAPDLIPLLAPLRYFGDYELLAEIARGGMGVVYRARQVSLDRVVAVKMMRPGLLATAEEIRRFRTEATAAAGLQHPNIVTIHEIGEQDGLHYYSMDLVEGRSLAEMVRAHPFEQRQAARTVATLAEAVGYAHGRGTLHRDLKPSNILVDDAGQPHITDFGLASSMLGEHRHTVTGSVMGTPAYMSPEQASGNTKGLTAASDVYSLGAILYELLTGRPPFQGSGVIETIQMARETAPVPPRVLNAKIDRDVETVVLKCLEKDAGRRYSTAGELAADLGRYLRREPVQARRIGRVARGWNWCRRHPWQTAVAAAILLVAGVSAGSAVLFRERLFESYLQQAKLQRVSHLDSSSLLRQAAGIHVNPALREEALQWSSTPRVTKTFEIPFGAVDECHFSSNSQRLEIKGWFMAPGSTLNRGWPAKTVTKVWALETRRFLDSGAGNGESFVPYAMEPAPDGLNIEKGAHLIAKGGSFSPDHRMFAATVVQGLAYSVVVWDMYRGEAIATLNKTFRPTWSPDGKMLATLGGGSLAFAGQPNGFTADTHDDRLVPMGNTLVTVWNVNGPPAVEHVAERVRTISFRLDSKDRPGASGREMAINGVRWVFSTGTFPGLDLARYDPPFGNTGGYDRYGRLIEIARPADHTVALRWRSGPQTSGIEDRSTAQPLSISPGSPERAGYFGERQYPSVNQVLVSPSGEHALIHSRVFTNHPNGGQGWDGRSLLELWSLESGARVASFSPPRLTQWYDAAVAFSPDSRLVAVYGRDRLMHEPIYLWESATGKLKGTIKIPYQHDGAMIFSIDGKTIYDAEKDFAAYDVGELRERRRWKGTGTRVRCLAMSMDGHVLLSGGEDGFIRLWRTSNGESLGGWEAQKAPVTALAFSSNGDVLASGGNDGSLRLWDFPSIRKQMAGLGLGF